MRARTKLAGVERRDEILDTLKSQRMFGGICILGMRRCDKL